MKKWISLIFLAMSFWVSACATTKSANKASSAGRQGYPYESDESITRRAFGG